MLQSHIHMLIVFLDQDFKNEIYKMNPILNSIAIPKKIIIDK